MSGLRLDPRSAPLSPLNLFQERYRGEPWRLLCCCICLNLCTGSALEAVHEDLFWLWPTPELLAAADDDLECLLSQLGLQNRRAKSLRLMSAAYPLWNGINPRDLPGIGEYGAHSYLLFIRGQLDLPLKDKELRKYLEWITKRNSLL